MCHTQMNVQQVSGTTGFQNSSVQGKLDNTDFVGNSLIYKILLKDKFDVMIDIQLLMYS